VSGDVLARVCGEIDARLRELRPAVSEYEDLLGAAASLGLNPAEPPVPSARTERPQAAAPPKRAVRGAAQQAIVAALEHGSHTVSELVVVTAMSATNIRDNLRRLVRAGTVTAAKREGKAAYVLSSPPT
jgi:hypothetical protein